VLKALSAEERADLLVTLLRAHPELIAEAERLAGDSLEREDRSRIADAVGAALRRLRLEDLAERAGDQWGGGYVEPQEAGREMLREVVDPHLSDMACRAKLGSRVAALEIGLGVLTGLYGCRAERDNDLALVHAGLPDAVDDLAYTVITAIGKAKLELPQDWLAEECPAWVSMAFRLTRARGR
jgi:hypothetical protein